MRFGWIEAANPAVIDAVKQVGYIRSQGGVAPVTGLIVAQGLRDGTVNAVLTRLCHAYQQRCTLLCDILEQASADGLLELICRPCGGYFVWVRLPIQLGPVNDFLDHCRERDVNFLPGFRCNACPDDKDCSEPSLERYVRFCFAFLDTETLRQGADVFVDCCRQYLLKGTSVGS